jgi:serine O-acetyltransferase
MRFTKDLKKYKKYSDSSALVLLCTQQGLWALFWYRFFNRIYRSSLPKLFKMPLLLLGVLVQKQIEIITGIMIPYSASIGTHFYIGHFGGIIINSKAVFGDNCNISQGVTIGVSGRGERRGVPVIGNNVYIGASATVAGDITIGDNVVIAANSLVISDVPENTTVMGVPAAHVSNNNSKGYI